MFTVFGRLFYYTVCHYGGTFSDYHWKRLMAFFMRWWHQLLWVRHRGWAYVDDSLWVFPSTVAPALALPPFLTKLNQPLRTNSNKNGLAWVRCWFSCGSGLVEFGRSFSNTGATN